MDAFRQAEEDELAAVYALRERAFGRGAAWFAAHDRDDPWRAAGATYVAARDGRVVATVRVFARSIRFGADTPAVACLGDVATDEPYRRQGYMRRLLAFVNEQNAGRGYALGLLSTGSPGAYMGAGFRVFPVPWYALDLPLPAAGRAAELVRKAESGGRWAIASPAAVGQEDSGAVYEAFGRGRPGYPVRDERLWSPAWSRVREGEAGWLRLAVAADGSVGAYLLARRSHRNPRDLTILECPYLPGAEDAAHLLLAALAGDPEVSRGGQVSLAGALPADHAFFAPDAPLPGRRDTAGHLMLRAYTREGAEAEETLRRAAGSRFVYWRGDNV
ncbi:MAG TPA: GNAT family N-acetyltransferase [Thermomicrobiales bacterium]|nr:GNAT family N-acetyltransferase [Thermomicrobiales bacterium]